MRERDGFAHLAKLYGVVEGGSSQVEESGELYERDGGELRTKMLTICDVSGCLYGKFQLDAPVLIIHPDRSKPVSRHSIPGSRRGTL